MIIYSPLPPYFIMLMFVTLYKAPDWKGVVTKLREAASFEQAKIRITSVEKGISGNLAKIAVETRRFQQYHLWWILNGLYILRFGEIE